MGAERVMSTHPLHVLVVCRRVHTNPDPLQNDAHDENPVVESDGKTTPHTLLEFCTVEEPYDDVVIHGDR